MRERQREQKPEDGKSKALLRLASNSICGKPKEHARLLRFFPGPVWLQPSQCAHTAPQAWVGVRLAGAGISMWEWLVSGRCDFRRCLEHNWDRAPLPRVRVCCQWMQAPWGYARVVNLENRGQDWAGLEAQSLYTYSQALQKLTVRFWCEWLPLITWIKATVVSWKLCWQNPLILEISWDTKLLHLKSYWYYVLKIPPICPHFSSFTHFALC